ncbi:MAG: putative glycoside hydrolase [Desulfitobacteriaceae bacterium]|nr:putative glycoside hydrolase [Desulfitobacteriaceae bacterium]
MLNQIKTLNSAKYVAQNNGWRELKNHTGQYIDFLFWSGYQDELGNSNEWLNNQRAEVLSLKNQYGVVPLAYKEISPENTAGMEQFYSTVKSQGLIPYAIPGVYTEINTYDLPVTPPDNPAPNPGLPHAVNSFVINLGVSDQHLEAMKKFDLAIVGPEISDYQLKELQSAGVQVIAYMATTSIDQQYPYYQGITDEDYLWVNGKKVANSNDYMPDWLMDPRSTHFRKIVVDTIKKDVFDRGFDGVYLDTLNQAAEYIEFYVSLDPTSMAKLKSELMAGSAQLAKEIREAGPNKILAHNNGWRELVNHTAPYIDFIMWEGYQYELGTSDEWLNQKRSNLINLSQEYDFTVLACRFFDYNDFAGVQEFYDIARSYEFIPYSPWTTNGQLWYNNVNTYGVPPRSPIPEQPPVEDPGEEEPPVDEEDPPTEEEPAPDTERPSSPRITTATAVNSNSIKLSWQKSTDNVSVDQYKIYRLDSTKGFIEHATTTDTTFTDTNLSKRTVYYYYVVAVDAAGNQSLITEVKSVQTKR